LRVFGFCFIVSSNYFTSSYIIGTGYQDFPFFWYNYGTKIGFLSHIFTAIPSKNFLQKYEQYSKPKAVLMFLFQLWMVAYLVIPRIPSHPLTEIHPD
jgi:hypothetical protein